MVDMAGRPGKRPGAAMKIAGRQVAAVGRRRLRMSDKRGSEAPYRRHRPAGSMALHDRAVR